MNEFEKFILRLYITLFTFIKKKNRIETYPLITKVYFFPLASKEENSDIHTLSYHI